MTRRDIIQGALDILSSRDSFGNSWLSDRHDVAIIDDAERSVRPACRTCLDGALNLAALGLSISEATLPQAVNGCMNGRDDIDPALAAAKDLICTQQSVGSPVRLNAQGYHAVVDVLQTALAVA